jgi:hypothetical protein
MKSITSPGAAVFFEPAKSIFEPENMALLERMRGSTTNLYQPVVEVKRRPKAYSHSPQLIDSALRSRRFRLRIPATSTSATGLCP